MLYIVIIIVQYDIDIENILKRGIPKADVDCLVEALDDEGNPRKAHRAPQSIFKYANKLYF